VIARYGLGGLEMKFLSGLGLGMKFLSTLSCSYPCTNITVSGSTEKVLIYYEITTSLTLYVSDPVEVDTVILQNQ
jgi:hypothetical protein